MLDLVIVGGGIAGLAAAHRAAKTAGARPGQIVLIEGERRLGGKIVTDRVDGFVIEGGPDTFLAYKPRGVGLCRELGLEARLHGTNPHIRRTYVMSRGRLYDLPEGLTGLVPSRFGPMARTRLISPWGKLRMGLDFFIPPRREAHDESLADFVERRLGREVYERLVEPLLSGIYAGDGRELSLSATFPQFRHTEIEHGGMIRGMLAQKRKAATSLGPNGSNGSGAHPKPQSGGARSAFLTPRTGLAEVVEAIEAALAAAGVETRTGMRAFDVQPTADGYEVLLADGAVLSARSVVLAAPAHASASLVAGFDPVLAAELSAIPHVSTATVSLAYRLADIPRPLDSYGYIVPRAEGRSILACTWTSTKFPHRAPEGYGLVRAFLGRAGQGDVLAATDEELVHQVRAELRQVLGVAAEPRLKRVYRWPGAMPQYTLGHLDRLGAIERRLAEHPGLFLAGNAYRGIGIPDCIASGEAAAEAALRHLAPKTAQAGHC